MLPGAPILKGFIVKKIVEKAAERGAENAIRRQNEEEPATQRVATSTFSPSQAATTTRRFVEEKKEAVTEMTHKVSEGIAQKEDATEGVKKLKTAAKVAEYAGVVCLAYSVYSFFSQSGFNIPSAIVGAVLFYAGNEGETILANLQAILDKPMSYKELSSGNWKIEKVREQLKKDTHLSGWVVDNVLIPRKFSNT